MKLLLYEYIENHIAIPRKVFSFPEMIYSMFVFLSDLPFDMNSFLSNEFHKTVTKIK